MLLVKYHTMFPVKCKEYIVFFFVKTTNLKLIDGSNKKTKTNKPVTGTVCQTTTFT